MRVTIDVGTGDGRAVLATAARDPSTLVLGIDASAAAMAVASRRAAGPARKGGLENARFVLAAAEAVPADLAGRADLVTVLFPWGSLLRGCVGRDEAVARGLIALVAPSGALELMLAPADRDGLGGMPTTTHSIVEAAARAFDAEGFQLVVAREATPAEVAATRSSWARRLGATRSTGAHGVNDANRRVATLIRLARR